MMAVRGSPSPEPMPSYGMDQPSPSRRFAYQRRGRGRFLQHTHTVNHNKVAYDNAGIVRGFAHEPLVYDGIEGPSQMRKLFVGGLHPDTTDEQLRNYFSHWGRLVDAIVMRDAMSRHSRGFGFVTFATLGAAEAAMNDRPHILGGKVVDTKRAIARHQMMLAQYDNPVGDFSMDPDCRVFVTGVQCDFHSVESLRLYFEQFDLLNEVEIVRRVSGTVGVLSFQSPDGADRALQHNEGRHNVNEVLVQLKRPPSTRAPLPPPPPALYRTPWKRAPLTQLNETTNGRAPSRATSTPTLEGRGENQREGTDGEETPAAEDDAESSDTEREDAESIILSSKRK